MDNHTDHVPPLVPVVACRTLAASTAAIRSYASGCSFIRFMFSASVAREVSQDRRGSQLVCWLTAALAEAARNWRSRRCKYDGNVPCRICYTPIRSASSHNLGYEEVETVDSMIPRFELGAQFWMLAVLAMLPSNAICGRYKTMAHDVVLVQGTLYLARLGGAAPRLNQHTADTPAPSGGKPWLPRTSHKGRWIDPFSIDNFVVLKIINCTRA